LFWCAEQLLRELFGMTDAMRPWPLLRADESVASSHRTLPVFDTRSWVVPSGIFHFPIQIGKKHGHARRVSVHHGLLMRCAGDAKHRDLIVFELEVVVLRVKLRGL
jgi:hypothetical protein